MRIFFASSEACPFSKTGGLADVSSSLPKALSRLGNDVILVIPAHRSSFFSGVAIKDLQIGISVPIGDRIVRGNLLESEIPHSNVRVILVQQDHYFDREGIYNLRGEDYWDNCERFVFFSRAVMEAMEALDWYPDILHTNDWQTGLIPAYQEVLYRNDPERPGYSDIATLHTIHNLAYQGVFWHWDMPLTGIDWKYFTFDKMEFYGKLNFLKTGISFARGITTVSPKYAEEIQTPQFGCGLEPVLQYRRDSIRGILNGICMDQWNPAGDKLIAAPYSSEDVFEKKPICKAALQKSMEIEVRPGAMLFGVVGRLAHQKGIDLILETAPDWIDNHNVQYCFLGTGDPSMERQLMELRDRFPGNVSAKLEFSNESAHLIEAGADAFLMPSRYEPCGLNQMYSLLYGTVPIVHETGGLADTVVDINDQTLANGTANGFRFLGPSAHELNLTIWRALECFYDRPEQWKQMMLTGMKEDWSWKKSARHYLDFYEELRKKDES